MNWKGTLASFGLIGIFGLLAFSIWRHDQVSDRLADLIEVQTLQHASHIERLERELAATNTRIDQQAALVSRALGDIVPVPIPGDLDKQLTELENLLASPERWPADQASVQDEFDRLGNIMGDLPTWVQEELFPRVVPIRWGLDALWYLRATADDDEGRLALLDSLESLQRNQPRGASPAITGQLTARINGLESDIQESDEATVKQALADGLSSDATLDEMLTALDILAAEDTAEPPEQLAQLERSVAVYLLEDRLNQVNSQLVQALGLTDETLKLAALSQARDAMIELQLRTASAKGDDLQLEPRLLETTFIDDLDSLGSRLEEAITDLQAGAAQRRDQAARDYQVWALGQIKKVRSHEEILDEQKGNIPNDDLFWSAAKKAASRVLREEMVNNLSRIDVGLLDIAVGEWFRKVYSDRFDQLNDEEKLALVQAFANSTKLGVGEHP